MVDSIVLVDEFHGKDWARSLKRCSFLDASTQMSSFLGQTSAKLCSLLTMRRLLGQLFWI